MMIFVMMLLIVMTSERTARAVELARAAVEKERVIRR